MENFMNQTWFHYLFQVPELMTIPWLNDTRLLSNNYSHHGNRRQTMATGRKELYYWRVGLFGFGGTAICCLGIICNIVVIIVLSRFRLKSSPPYFILMCLSILDCIYLMSFLFLETLSTLSSAHEITAQYLNFIAPVYGYLFWVPLVCQTCTAYVVVVITLERFVLIAKPLHARVSCKLISFRKAVFSVCLCVAFSSLYHIPDYLAFYLEEVWNQRTQTHITRIKRTEFGEGHFYTKVYFTWMNFTVNFLVPFVLLLIFNGVTLGSLYRSSASGTIRVPEAQQKHLTLMIISMIAVFFVCELLAAISFIFTAHLFGYHHTTIEINRLSALADTLMLLKSACNFFIYCFTGTKFKQAFCGLFCRCFQTRRNPASVNPRARDSTATTGAISQTIRVRPLSSLSTSSGGRRVSAANNGSSGVNPKYRRSSSNASSGLDDGAKNVVSGRPSSNGSGVSHNSHTNHCNNHTRARVSLSTIAASDSCVGKTSNLVEMEALIEHNQRGDGEGKHSEGLQAQRDKIDNTSSESQFSQRMVIPGANGSKKRSDKSIDAKDETECHGLLNKETDREAQSTCVVESGKELCDIENTQIDDNVFNK